MPPEKEPDPNRARTRAGNANRHPGTAAKDALRVRNPPRDPEIIQKERAEKEEKKAAKKKEIEQAQAREDSAAQFVEEYRARKDAEASNEAMAIPRRKPTKAGKVPNRRRDTGKPESDKANTAGTSETFVNQGTKRKNDNQLEMEANKSTSVPLKKAKTSDKADKSTSKSAIAPHQKKRAPAAAPSTSKGSRKRRANLTDDEGTALDDPKTPIPPLKKSRSSKGDKPQPVRRTETLIFEDGSVVKTTSRINSKTPSNEEVEADETPRPQGSCVSKEPEVVEISDDEPYITPFVLKRVRKAAPPPPDDTEVENSDIEQQLRAKASKKAGAVKGSNDKVRSESAVAGRAQPKTIQSATSAGGHAQPTGKATASATGGGPAQPKAIQSATSASGRSQPKAVQSESATSAGGHAQPTGKATASATGGGPAQPKAIQSATSASGRSQPKAVQSESATSVSGHSQASRSSHSHRNEKKAVSVPAPSASVKRTTTNSNNVIVTHTSAAPTSKAKPKSKALKSVASVDNESVMIEMQDEDGSHEEEVALASPLKGSESRKMSETKVKVEPNASDWVKVEHSQSRKGRVPLPFGTLNIFNNDILPTWQARIFSTRDSWPNIDVHLNKLQSSWDLYLGKEYPHKIDKNTDAYHKAKARLCDLRNRMKNKSDQVALDEFRTWVGDDEKAMKDEGQRIAFGKEYCSAKEWKFIWEAFDKERGIHSGKYKNKMILETYAIFFTFAIPANPLPNLEIAHPQGALALATAAVERSLSLYRDGHLEWNKGTLSLKAPEENDSAKLKKSVKYDFSYANWGEATERWLKGVKKRYTTLFPDVSKQARILAGIKVKAGTESLSSETDSDSSGRDLDSDYEGVQKVSDNNHQNKTDSESDGNGWNEDAGGQQECDDGHVGGQQSDNEADNEEDDGEEDDGDRDEDGGEEQLGNASDCDVVGDGDCASEIGVRSEHSGLGVEPEPSELSDLSDSTMYCEPE